ncbi:MAG: CoA ester lyase [Candidatus Pelagadaptatus aseana]|uniref:HpcH/HpaI aldolase/citrate lyase family protein n=1 Tax=Candidatus Pelagadaptatus aseana TaxID=3120508 RepID=UPI0039B21527
MTSTPASNSTLRPRRSVLYMPGANARAMDKARGLDADAVIFDLEDAVAPDMKAAAREQVIATLKQGGYGNRELIVRINSLQTPWGKDDLLALLQAGVAFDGVCLPKVETAEQVLAVAELIAQQGNQALALWPMIETPLGVANAQAIAAAHPNLTAIVMGTSDLSKEMRIPHTPDRIGFIGALSQCVLAARCHHVDIIDGVYLDIKDSDGFARICQQGRDLGFDGKSLIHPAQLVDANRVFGPSAADVDKSRRILQVWQEALAEGKGVAVLDGKLVENLHVDEAERTLAIAEAIANR